VSVVPGTPNPNAAALSAVLEDDGQPAADHPADGGVDVGQPRRVEAVVRTFRQNLRRRHRQPHRRHAHGDQQVEAGVGDGVAIVAA
jgi:hypothetical protein